MSPCKCGKCAINEALLAAGDEETVHTRVECFAIGDPLYPMMLKLAQWEAHPTWTFAQSMADWPAYGNLHRLYILEKHVCLRCGESREHAGCSCPRLHEREPAT